MSLVVTIPRPNIGHTTLRQGLAATCSTTTLCRRTRDRGRHDRAKCRWPSRLPIPCSAAASKHRLSATIVSVRIARPGTAHQGRRIDKVSAVGADDDSCSRACDSDSIGAYAELCFIAVAGHSHPEVEVRLGLRRATAAGVLD